MLETVIFLMTNSANGSMQFCSMTNGLPGQGTNGVSAFSGQHTSHSFYNNEQYILLSSSVLCIVIILNTFIIAPLYSNHQIVNLIVFNFPDGNFFLYIILSALSTETRYLMDDLFLPEFYFQVHLIKLLFWDNRIYLTFPSNILVSITIVGMFLSQIM